MLYLLTIIIQLMANSSYITTESGGRQNIFPTEPRPYIDNSVSYDGYPQNPRRNIHKIENIRNTEINMNKFSSLKDNNSSLFFLI